MSSVRDGEDYVVMEFHQIKGPTAQVDEPVKIGATLHGNLVVWKKNSLPPDTNAFISEWFEAGEKLGYSKQFLKIVMGYVGFGVVMIVDDFEQGGKKDD